MKYKVGVVSIVAFLLVLLSAQAALAVVDAVPVRKVYSVSNVQPFAYSELISATTKGMNGVQVNNSGIHPVMLAFGGSGSEVNQIIVGGNQDTGYMPLQAGYATRLSVIALDGPNETGELDVNVLY